MPHLKFTTLVLVVALIQVMHTLPISSNHRIAIYTPYWQQGSRSRFPQEFAQKRPNCVTELCAVKPNVLPVQNRNDYANTIPLIKTSKRNKNLYKTGWTMGGMPFSVLYMNPKPQISVRSPVAEPLRSPAQFYDNSDVLAREMPPALENTFEDYVQEMQAQPLTSGIESPVPTLIPTRRQYSIIPQLFVSYGWGPLGKRN